MGGRGSSSGKAVGDSTPQSREIYNKMLWQGLNSKAEQSGRRRIGGKAMDKLKIEYVPIWW